MVMNLWRKNKVETNKQNSNLMEDVPSDPNHVDEVAEFPILSSESGCPPNENCEHSIDEDSANEDVLFVCGIFFMGI